MIKMARNYQMRIKKTKEAALIQDIRALILSTRAKLAQSINSGLVLVYWHIGQRILKEKLDYQRAKYGKKIIQELSKALTKEFGAGFTSEAILHMIRFAEVFPKKEIVYALSTELGWTHFRKIIYIKEPLKRDFYAEMCRIERWSTRTLDKKIQSMLFERTAISKKPDQLIRQELKSLRAEDRLTPDLVFRDPYLLDFLGLKNTYDEKDLESAILHEIENFLIELGSHFTFVARQKRITIDHKDYYIDLLFYHRLLRRMIVIELKIGEFQAADKGQLELYLKWLNKYERLPHEESPIGLILCADKTEEHVELLDLEKSEIRIATYFTKELPPKTLEKKLHQAILQAKEKLSKR